MLTACPADCKRCDYDDGKIYCSGQQCDDAFVLDTDKSQCVGGYTFSCYTSLLTILLCLF